MPHKDPKAYREYQKAYYRTHQDSMRKRARIRARIKADRRKYEKRYIAFALAYWRRVPSDSKRKIWTVGLGDDLFQSLRLAGLEIMRKAYDLDDHKEARQAWLWIGRYVHKILKDYGFYRPVRSPGYESRYVQTWKLKTLEGGEEDGI